MTSTVVVTGMGVISPFGRGVAALWEGLRAGRAAIGPITVFDTSAHRTQIAGQVPEGEDSEDLRSMAPRARARLTRAERFALEAAFEAVRAAGLDPRAIPEGAGVFFGSSAGGMLEAESYYRDLRGP